MTRTFKYSFEPAGSDPVKKPTVALTVQEIQDVGLKEVLQTPGVPFGAWSILDALLVPGASPSPFTFKEPLGQAREVKTAISGLFGRFVARAYLEKHFNLSVFGNLGSEDIDLDGRLHVRIARKRGHERGDLPDWVACDAVGSSLTIAEAKGSQSKSGPKAALKAGWEQAGRIDVLVGAKRMTLKRIAVATHWGNAIDGPASSEMMVKDPLDQGDDIDAKEEDAAFIGLVRLHIANLIRPLGHQALSSALIELNSARGMDIGSAEAKARNALERSQGRPIEQAPDAGTLIGGVVTRIGALEASELSRSDRETLKRLNLEPTFFGLERILIEAAVKGDPAEIRQRMQRPREASPTSRPDRAGGWIVPLDPDNGP